MRRAFAALAVAGFVVVAPLSSQGFSDAFLTGSLAVRFHAFVPQAVDRALTSDRREYAWDQEYTKYTMPGSAVSLKLVFDNGIVLLHATPFNSGNQGATLVTQGQIWIRANDGGLSYRTTLESVGVAYGESLLYFPFGVDSSGKAPLRIEIVVLRAADLPPPASSPPAASPPSPAPTSPAERLPGTPPGGYKARR